MWFFIFIIEIVPPHMHWQVELLVHTGFPQASTVFLVFNQGVIITDLQGACCTVPNDDAITAATAGFVGVLHIPKLINVLVSVLVTIGVPSTFTVTLNAVNGIGVNPNEHLHILPEEITGIIKTYIQYLILIDNLLF